MLPANGLSTSCRASRANFNFAGIAFLPRFTFRIVAWPLVNDANVD
jgi:hypothetical protein